MTREARMTGKKGIESMLYSLVAAGLTFIIILWLFLEKNVISRILNLSRDVVRAGDGNFSNASFSHEKKNDEIFIQCRSSAVSLADCATACRSGTELDAGLCPCGADDQ